MKQLLSTNSHIQLIDTDKDTQQGFQFGEVMYKIKGDSISFYYQEDYLYDNTLFSAYIPKFQIDGVIYDKNTIAEALDTIFTGISVVSGDMLKAEYDTNNNGIVDNAEKLDGYLPSELPVSEPTQNILDSKVDKTNGVVFNDDNNIELREGTKVLGKDENGVEYEILGLNEYEVEKLIPLTEIKVGDNLRGKTLYFDTSIPIELVDNDNNGGAFITYEIHTANDDLYSAFFFSPNSWNPEFIIENWGGDIFNSHNFASSTSTPTWLMNEFTYSDEKDHIVTRINNGFTTIPAALANIKINGGSTIVKQVEVGSESLHLNLNTVDDITVDTHDGKKTIAYKEYVDGLIGDINSILEEING